MVEQWLLIEAINPEPWEAPEGAIGRKGGKPFVMMFKPEGVKAYQEAIREELEARELTPTDQPCRLDLWFWRNTGSWSDGGSRKGRGNIADATNLQKATEDALQGILFINDRQVTQIISDIVDQGPDVEPQILLRLSHIDPAQRILGISQAEVLREARPISNSNFRDIPDIF